MELKVAVGVHGCFRRHDFCASRLTFPTTATASQGWSLWEV
jgi:G:T-mismatch repair DNA endonuclease (very short patch repair protein)